MLAKKKTIFSNLKKLTVKNNKQAEKQRNSIGFKQLNLSIKTDSDSDCKIIRDI